MADRKRKAAEPMVVEQELQHFPEKLRALAVPLEKLTLDPRNARRHGDANMAAVRESLQRFGWRGIVVADEEGIVLAGNARVQAARDLGWTHAPVLRVPDREALARAFAIMDNRSAELAVWDSEGLVEQLQELAEADLLGATGFSVEDLDKALEGLGQFGVEAAAAPDLAAGDRQPIQQMTFTLHDEQVEIVQGAIAAAKKLGPFVDTGNENENGNALARIAEVFLGSLPT